MLCTMQERFATACTASKAPRFSTECMLFKSKQVRGKEDHLCQCRLHIRGDSECDVVGLAWMTGAFHLNGNRGACTPRQPITVYKQQRSQKSLTLTWAEHQITTHIPVNGWKFFLHIQQLRSAPNHDTGPCIRLFLVTDG